MTQTETSTLHLPRILCLHGGGVNGPVFSMQMRAVAARLGSAFRLVFMDAPFLSAPHPSIVPVYGDHGPFRRWLRWEADHPDIEPDDAAAQIAYQCRRAMDDDPGSGDFVGILGFSQGAKVAAGVLWTQQEVDRRLGPGAAATDFRFGVFMAGRGPVLLLDWRLELPPHVGDPSQLSSAFDDWPAAGEGGHVVELPTLHVHGLRDPGLEQHRQLRRVYCAEGTATLVEWDGGHRIPIKAHDVEVVSNAILELAKRAGVRGAAVANGTTHGQDGHLMVT